MIRRTGVLLMVLALAACATDQAPVPQTAADRVRLAPTTTAIPLDAGDPDALARVIRANVARGITATYRLVAPAELAAAARAQLDRGAADGLAPVTLGVTPGAALRVEVTRLGAHVPACPDWSRRSDEDFSNRPSSNFGCADAVNLAAQVADPADLIAGRGRATTAAGPLAAAVAALAADRVKPLKAAATAAQGGPISDDPHP